jgi:hypothetical protein
MSIQYVDYQTGKFGLSTVQMKIIHSIYDTVETCPWDEQVETTWLLLNLLVCPDNASFLIFVAECSFGQIISARSSITYPTLRVT